MASISKNNVSEDSILNILKYKTHPSILSGTKEFIDFTPLSKFEVTEDPEDIYHEVTEVDKSRLDLIAWQYYGNVNFWWVIAVVNDIYDPFTDLTPGTIIRIPNQSNVYEALRKYRKIEED